MTARSGLVERRFQTVGEMSDHVASDICEAIHSAVAARGGALICVSGGRFSKHYFDALRGMSLPWHQVTVVLADERWVDTSDSMSNENLIRNSLLNGEAAAATFVGLKESAADAADSLCAIERRLDSLPLPFDLVLLGMGDDGHTASLFPSAGADELGSALHPSSGERAALLNPTVSPVPRISLTLPTLLNTRRIILHVPGASKLQTYRRAMEDGPVEAMPVRAILRQTTVPVDILLCENEDP